MRLVQIFPGSAGEALVVKAEDGAEVPDEGYSVRKAFLELCIFCLG